MASDSRLVETDELAPAVWQVDEAKLKVGAKRY
jgi:hypothetical protein